MRRLLPVLLLLAIIAASCSPRPAPVPRQASPPAPTAVVAGPVSPTPVPPPTVAAPAASPATTPSPLTAVAPVSATRSASPATSPAPTATQPAQAPAAWDEWPIYLSALRPDQRPPVNGPAAGGDREATLDGMTQYHLTVSLDAGLKVLTGSARIRYTNRSQDTLAVIYLHLFPNLWQDGMSVASVQAGGKPAASTLQADNSLLQITLPTPLAPGAATELALDFSDPIPDNGDMGNYGDFAYQDNVLALAQFYPTVVVYDQAGWHLERPSEQGDVLFNQASLYDVTVTAPAALTLAATGQTLDRRDNGDGSATWRIAGGPMRDFNMIASPRYEQASRTSGEITITSYFLPEDRQGGQQALDWATAALKTYESDFGPYPYHKLDVVETPTTAGGIEYPGLVVVASSLYAAADRRDFFEGATVHEVAHQWWYNVVGDDQVNTPWLDEALAQYSSYFYYQTAYGARGADGYVASLRGRWQRVNNEDKPIGLPVADYSGQEYGAIVYGRGPLFLLAVQEQVGEDAMLRFLKRYYSAYAWRIATPAGFQALLQEVAGQDLSSLFAAWVYPRR